MNKQILEYIIEIKGEHPFWGYRRVWGYIRSKYELEINKKRVYRLMRNNNLLCPKNNRLKATRSNSRSKPKAERPNHIWGTDMTKIMIPNYGWAYLHIVLDWFTKKVVGWSISKTSKTRDWLDALELAVMYQFPEGSRENNNISLVSDNGSQPTSKTFARHCKLLGIKQIFTSYSNPKGNAETERMMRTIKEDLVYVNEFESIIDFREKFDKWVNWYNNEYPHSANNYKPPYQVERDFVKHEATLICT